MWTVFVRCVWELRPWMTSELTRDFSYLYFPQSLPFVLLSLDINPLHTYLRCMFAHVVHGYLFMVQFLCFLRLNSQFDVVVTVGWCLLIKLFLVRISCFCQDKADRDVSQCLIKKKTGFVATNTARNRPIKSIQGRNSDKCSDPLALKTFS